LNAGITKTAVVGRALTGEDNRDDRLTAEKSRLSSSGKFRFVSHR
jgi:hypothetical protein